MRLQVPLERCATATRLAPAAPAAPRAAAATGAASAATTAGVGSAEVDRSDPQAAPKTALPTVAPAVVVATAGDVQELQWLRLDSSLRGSSSLADLNEFWRCLRGLFVQRETRELQAAQLLALGEAISPHLGEATRAHGHAELSCAGLLRRKTSILFYARRGGSDSNRLGTCSHVFPC